MTAGSFNGGASLAWFLGETDNQPRVDPPRLDTKRRQTSFNLPNTSNEFSQAESLGRGSSVGILSSAFRLRECLAQILFLFRDNAPSHQQREFLVNPNLMDRNRKVRGRKSTSGRCPANNEDNLDLESLPEHTRQFKYPGVQRHVHDLAVEMGEHSDSITGTLSMFIEVGVLSPNLLTLSTVTTFSAVTATTPQFSYSQTGDMLSDGVSAFWFSSFVFSIAAAVNGLLGLSWKQAMYLSPGDCVPRWVLTWIKPPLVFFVTSTIIRTVFTAFTSFDLAAVLAWFASEKWIFVHHSESKWLSDVLKDALRRFMALRLVSIVSKSFGWCSRYVQKGVEAAGHKFRRVSSMGTITTTTLEQDDSLTTGEYAHTISRSPEPLAPLSPIRQSTDSYSHFSGETIRSVMMLQSAMSFPSNAFSSLVRKRTTLPAFTDVSRVMSPTAVTTTFRGSKVASLIPKLESLEATQDLAAHSALDPCVPHRVLAHAPGFVDQIAWSPAGVLILTRLNRAIKIFEPMLTIECHHHVQSIAWLPGGEAFLSVQGSEVIKLVLDTYRFNRVSIHDVAITPDLQWLLLGVGPVLYSPKGLHPSKSRVEKQLLVYDIKTKVIEMLHNVRDTTLAKNGQVALAFPQLWKLEMVKDQAQLTLCHTYMPKVPVDFAGPTIFGARMISLCLVPARYWAAGDIHIWDRDSAVLLHHVCPSHGQGPGARRMESCFRQPFHFKFATGSHDGAVRLWTMANDYRPLCESSRHLFAMTVQSKPHFVTPRSPSVVDNGARTDSPLTLTPVEDGG
ncbi:hypothetical protein BDR05DRAFT_976122 [Suillus weaverae]|nr:hypothetical protein BDR05DRAFT_976122 [Suillus weaverae]